MPIKEKACTQCRQSWPATWEFFYNNKGSKDGLRSECKACFKKAQCTQSLRKLF